MKHLNFFLSLAVPVLLLSHSELYSQTHVSGLISNNTSWNLPGSPYIVTGNILVSSGATLTIEPGVIVKFDSAKALQIDGELIANGTAGARIVFTSNRSIPAPGDWGRIQFSNFSVDAVINSSGQYLSGSSLQFCDIMYGGGAGGAQLLIDQSSPFIEYCLISESASDGIKSNLSESNVNECTIKNCVGYGLNFYAWKGISISKDSILFNSNGGVNIENSSIQLERIDIRNNYFEGNGFNGAITSFITHRGLNLIENYFVNNTSFQTAIVNNTMVDDTIACNYFTGNSVSFSAGTILNSGFGPNKGIIVNNYFENNSCLNGGYICRASLGGDINSPSVFANNIFINNNSDETCRITVSTTPGALSNVMYNTFTNNNSDVELTIYQLNQINNYHGFLNFKYNNFPDPTVKIKLLNSLSFGSPSFNADSNYWSSTSSSYLDSVIYDYFDDPTFAVVYRTHAFSSQVSVDTNCSLLSTGLLKIERQSYFSLYPNPVQNHLTLLFNSFIDEGSLTIYNILGANRMFREIRSLSEIQVDLSSFEPGFYIAGIRDGNAYYSKKFVVN